MTAPLVTPDDLGTLLADVTIDQGRAADIIADVQTLCESYVSPLPAACAVVVKRVAARAYVSTVPARPSGGGSPIGMSPGAAPANPGGLVLWKSDVKDLRRLAGGSAAFDIDMIPSDYALPSDLPYWDDEDTLPGDGGSV